MLDANATLDTAALIVRLRSVPLVTMSLGATETRKDVIALDVELVTMTQDYAVASKDIVATGASIRLFSVRR